MKWLKHVLGLSMVAFACAGLMVACGDTSGDCLTDDDCSSDQACEYDTGQCREVCEDDGDTCLDDEECVDREGEDDDEDVMICVEDEDYCEEDEDCDGGELCNSDTNQCAVNCGDDADVCEDDQECVEREDDEGSICVEEDEEEPFYEYARVEDISATGSDEACENPDTNDPGSDLFGVELTKDGESYWATLTYEAIVNEDESGNPNEHTDADAILNGEAPELDDDECPADFSGNVVSLGCGGQVIVEFHDDEGENVIIEAGDEVTVHEWGEETCGGHAEDAYELDICTSGQEEVENGDCAGIGQGENEADVTTYEISLEE